MKNLNEVKELVKVKYEEAKRKYNEALELDAASPQEYYEETGYWEGMKDAYRTILENLEKEK